MGNLVETQKINILTPQEAPDLLAVTLYEVENLRLGLSGNQFHLQGVGRNGKQISDAIFLEKTEIEACQTYMRDQNHPLEVNAIMAELFREAGIFAQEKDIDIPELPLQELVNKGRKGSESKGKRRNNEPEQASLFSLEQLLSLGIEPKDISPIALAWRETLDTPLLSAWEEIRLSRAWRFGNDEEAREYLFRANMRLVVFLAMKKYRCPYIPDLDLIQEGAMGLLFEAIKRYDPRRGWRLSTYAFYRIRQRIMKCITDTSSTIRVSADIFELLPKYNETIVRLRSSNPNLNPNSREGRTLIADILGVSATTVATLTQAKNAQRTTSLEALEENRRFPGRQNGHPRRPVEAAAETEDTRNRVALAVQDLRPRRQQVIESLYGLGGKPPMTQAAIGRKSGRTRENVRQLKQKALAQLQEAPSLKDIYP